MEILKTLETEVSLTDKETLIKCVTTCLSSKIVSGSSATLSPLAVDSVLKIIDPKTDKNVDLRDIRVTKKVSGTIDDTEMIDGICFTN